MGNRKEANTTRSVHLKSLTYDNDIILHWIDLC